MEISVKRDGLTLRGTLLKPEGADKCPVAVIFHGIMSNRGNKKANMFSFIADALLKKGIASVRFDFNGHGESDGDFSDMNVYADILDAGKILDYVRNLDFVTDIYVVGHSMGGLVGGMISGYYREYVKKLVMLAPAATMKDDAIKGSCFGIEYDKRNIPETIEMFNNEKESFLLGHMLFRTAKTLPIYETTSMFEGKTLIIHGSDDDAAGVIGSKRYAEAMDNVTLHIIDGETHGLDTISLDSVVNEVADFLSE